jgi:hypothetical protein
MSGVNGRLGPSVVLHDGKLVEEMQGQEAGCSGLSPLERHLTITRSRLHLGCATLSADAVEFVIRAWWKTHPEESL